MSNNTILNFCENMTIYCLNHDEPLPMQIISNTEFIKTPFYACQNYRPQDRSIPPCSNRLNLDDYLGIAEKFMEAVSNGDFMTNFTNYEFSYKGHQQKILVKCLKYTPEEIRLGIRNQTVLGQKK